MKTLLHRTARAALVRFPGLFGVLRRRQWPAPLRETVWGWRSEAVLQRAEARRTVLDVISGHVRHSFGGYLAVPLFAIPLALQARTMVELGSAFSYYPDTYADGDPTGVSTSGTEGMLGTRFMLSAARILRSMGIPATVTSVELRTADDPLMERSRRLLADLGLEEYWRPVMGTDTVAWLRGQADPIDFALVDSNHTYRHVLNELDALAPLMSDRSAIVIDNAYTYYYQNPLWRDASETVDGARRGGKFGAVREWAASHPEWDLVWGRDETAILIRGWSL